MADLLPFKGIIYNSDKIKDLSTVVTPPYDVISEVERDNYYDMHPNNIIRLILGKINPSDNDSDNRYTRANKYFNEWIAEEMLSKDDTDSFYVNATEFNLNGKKIIRYGLIASVKIETFEKGIVLPHEKTFSKIKSERLKLIKSCKANLSPIFSLFNETDGNVLNILKNSIKDELPIIDIVDKKNMGQKLWRINNRDICDTIIEAMKLKQIFIADGHHRYETALNYRNWVKENDVNYSDSHPSNYIMMYLASMNDPGLVILPAHRIVKDINRSLIEEFLINAKNYFAIKEIPFDYSCFENVCCDFVDMLKNNTETEQTSVIGLIFKDIKNFYLFELKSNVMEECFNGVLDKCQQDLDVCVLTNLILMKLLKFDQARLDDKSKISYSSDAKVAAESIRSGENDIAFILNPTKIKQVQDIAEKGLVMPRKSTYFYPKVGAGLVIRHI